jgi:hypothetical protein
LDSGGGGKEMDGRRGEGGRRLYIEVGDEKWVSIGAMVLVEPLRTMLLNALAPRCTRVVWLSGHDPWLHSDRLG